MRGTKSKQHLLSHYSQWLKISCWPPTCINTNNKNAKSSVCGGGVQFFCCFLWAFFHIGCNLHRTALTKGLQFSEAVTLMHSIVQFSEICMHPDVPSNSVCQSYIVPNLNVEFSRSKKVVSHAIPWQSYSLLTAPFLLHDRSNTNICLDFGRLTSKSALKETLLLSYLKQKIQESWREPCKAKTGII